MAPFSRRARGRSPGARRALDFLLLVAVAALASATLVGVILLSVTYHFSIVWLLGVAYGAMFIFAVVRFAYSKFRRPLFIPFFLLGLAALEAASFGAFRWGGIIAAMVSFLLGIFIFFTLTGLWFGPISLSSRKSGGAG